MSGTEKQPPKKEWTLMFYFASDNPLAPSIVTQLKAIKQAGHHPEVNVITHFDPHTVGTPTHVFDVNIINKLKSKSKGKPEGPQSTLGFGDDPFVRNLLEDKLWGEETFEPNSPPTNGGGGATSGAARGAAPARRLKVRDRLKEVLEGLKYDPPPYPPPPEKGNGSDPKRSPRSDPSTQPGGKHEPDPQVALRQFLDFCRRMYPARHYILFILGHGLAVGDEEFLFDEHADRPSLSLTQFATELKTFSAKINEGDRFELVSFHSCSVSSLEMVYELEGTANYMLATQSPAFVGSWPYQQIVTRIINDQRRARRRTAASDRAADDAAAEQRIQKLIGKIFDYCYYNSTDFLLAGYSFALTLCDLRRVREVIREPVKELSGALKQALDDSKTKEPLLKDLIQLAHLRSQSYWHETYTDLFDFCLCLKNICADYRKSVEKTPDPMAAIRDACDEVMRKLGDEAVKYQRGEDRLVMRCAYAGPAYQYSHGLSVFFPWTEPSADNALWWKVTPDGRQEPGDYMDYTFSDKEYGTDWHEFLKSYFKETMRDTRGEEDAARKVPTPQLSELDQLAEAMASLVYNEEGQLSADSILKNNPREAVGDECNCSTIKNFPRDTRARPEKREHAVGDSNSKIPLYPGRR